jgi:hypothetical protein
MFNFGRNATIGTNNEPALTSANTILQTILGAPFAWRWNRAVIGFITTPGQQDYFILNWTAGKTVKAGWQTVDGNGNAQVVLTPGTLGSNPPTWNPSTGQNTQDGTALWKNLGPLLTTVSTSYRFGWTETASVYSPSAKSGSKWKEIPSQLCLALDAEEGRPEFIAAQGDDGQGNITFRITPAPDQIYTLAVTVQQTPPLFTGTSQTWAPIPDEYSRIYNWGLLALLWLFADDPRFQEANQKFVTQLLGTSEGLTETQRNIFLSNWQAVTGQPISNTLAKNQGFQARAV